jgi:mediator of RNA polymerase II transcription subunit 14
MTDNPLRLRGADAHKRPQAVIEYAKITRQAVLKYLAVLRWKTTVDLATTSGPAINGVTAAAGPAASFPTPHSNESNNTSPTAFPLKAGKARSGETDTAGEEIRGKVTDGRRIQQFLEHQHAQHELAITHIQHVTKGIDTLR